MVYKNLPVEKTHIIDLQEKYGLSNASMAALMGTPEVQLTELGKNPKPGEELASPTMAIHARLIEEFKPDLEEPSFKKLQKLLQNQGIDATPRQLAILCGREKTAGTRWDRGEKYTQQMVALFGTLIELFENTSAPKRLFKEIISIAEKEAKLRGIDDVFKSGKWDK